MNNFITDYRLKTYGVSFIYFRRTNILQLLHENNVTSVIRKVVEEEKTIRSTFTCLFHTKIMKFYYNIPAIERWCYRSIDFEFY